ncbi:MAG: hypothetical protein WCK42_08950 [Myxococcaceae bacterium]
MKFTIVFLFLLSFNSIAGNSGIRIGRPATFAVAELISASTQQAKNILEKAGKGLLDRIFSLIVEEKFSIQELIKNYLEASRDLTVTNEELSQKEAELNTRSVQDPRMNRLKSSDSEPKEQGIYIEPSKQSVSVPGMRMAPTEGERSCSSGTEKSDEGTPGASDDEPEVPEGRGTFSLGTGTLEMTPGSDFRGRDIGRYEGQELRDIISYFTMKTLGDPKFSIYLITTGAADLARLPIWDLGNRVLSLNEIEVLLGDIKRTLREQRFNRYVGITGRGAHKRLREHARATVTHPYRRLPLAILNENAQGNAARMHVLLRGVHPSQLHRLEARLIRDLEATGLAGLNGNTGHLGLPEHGVRGHVEVTPSSATPGLQGGRQVLFLNQNHLAPLPQAEIPLAWQDIIYLITPPGEQIEFPIIDLGLQATTEEQMQMIEEKFKVYLSEMANRERYVGMAGSGIHGKRTAYTRAGEHERASLDTPHRRLPLAITRINQEQGAVKMHVLLTGVRAEDIAWVEGRLIRLFGGTTALGWNSNPGFSPPTEPERTKRTIEDVVGALEF